MLLTACIKNNEYDGNIGPWLHLADDLGLNVKWLNFDLDSYEYDIIPACVL